MTDTGTWLSVDDDMGTSFNVQIKDEEEIHRACEQWAERRINTYLRLTGRSGCDFSIFASHIVSVRKLTRAQRKEGLRLDMEDKDERKEYREELGWSPPVINGEDD